MKGSHKFLLLFVLVLGIIGSAYLFLPKQRIEVNPQLKPEDKLEYKGDSALLESLKELAANIEIENQTLEKESTNSSEADPFNDKAFDSAKLEILDVKSQGDKVEVKIKTDTVKEENKIKWDEHAIFRISTHLLAYEKWDTYGITIEDLGRIELNDKDKIKIDRYYYFNTEELGIARELDEMDKEKGE